MIYQEAVHLFASGAELPIINIQSGHDNIIALIDTGATNSFVHEKYFLNFTDVPVNYASVANGERTLVYGPVHFPFTIQGEASSIQAYVMPDMPEEVILGMDWLAAEEAIMDLKNGCVYFGTTTRQAAYWRPNQHLHFNIPPVPLEEINIPEYHRTIYEEIIKGFPDVFHEAMVQPTTKLVKHTIRLRDPRPFKIRRYQYSPIKKQIIREEVEKMLAAGVIRRSHSAFSSPIVIAQKKNGKSRFCIDYRRLNEQTEDEVAQLPPIRETLQELGNAKVFTSLDLRSGYW